MNGFVQMFSSGPGDEGDPEHYHVSPPWFGPPAEELGESVPFSVVVASSDRAVVALRSATAFSTGSSFDFLAAGRGLTERETNRLFHEQHLVGDEDEPPAAFLRIGFELADGRRVSNLGRDHRFTRPDQEPDGPVLFMHGGGGGSAGGGRFTLQPGLWLWPLPPPGPLRVFVEWPAMDIALAHAELDSEIVRGAASRSKALWPES